MKQCLQKLLKSLSSVFGESSRAVMEVVEGSRRSRESYAYPAGLSGKMLEAFIMQELSEPTTVVRHWTTTNSIGVYYDTEHYQIEGRNLHAYTDHAGCGSFTFLEIDGVDYSYKPEDEFDYGKVYRRIKELANKDKQCLA